MTLFHRPKLAISLPALELARIAVPGSVFSLEELDVERLSMDLQAELDRIATTFALSRSDVFIIPRSEMFTHGDTLNWLKARLPGVQDHLCLSDGSSLKVVPGYTNHVFFFRPYLRDCRINLARMLSRAPELFASCKSQINSAHSVLCSGSSHSPETILLQGRSRWPGEPVAFYPFYLDPSRLNHTLAAAQATKQWPEEVTRWERTTVVCLTEASLLQLTFVRYVARLLLAIVFTPQRRLLLVAPMLEFSGLSAQERLSVIYTALAPHLGDLPRAGAINISTLMGTLEDFQREERQDSVQDLILPASAAFWRCDISSYSAISRIMIFPDTFPFSPNGGHDLYMAALGQPPSVVVLGDESVPLFIPELET